LRLISRSSFVSRSIGMKAKTRWGAAECAQVAQRGYATILCGGGTRAWLLILDTSAVRIQTGRDDLQARVDFGFRGVHLAAVAGKGLTEVFYGRTPRWSYFLGSSTGGRLAMVEAERFPTDFNGILSGVPILTQTGDQMAIMWSSLAFRAKDGVRFSARRRFVNFMSPFWHAVIRKTAWSIS
jgi:hypothetical protein